jgi:hemoglobin
VKDIETREDCEALVRRFYTRALDDDVIGWLFVDVAHINLKVHVPIITSFWETVLLGARSYSGGAFGPHAALHSAAGLRPGHFARWLQIWRETVDAMYAGPVADLAKAHAERVAAAFSRRLAVYDEPPPSGDGFQVLLRPGRPRVD